MLRQQPPLYLRFDPMRGNRIFKDLMYHDHGVAHYGGENGLILGKLGGGKSTLLLHIAEYTRYFEDFSKDLYLNILAEEPERLYELPIPNQETTIMRATKFSHWTNLIPENWDPDYKHRKPLILFAKRHDPLQLTHVSPRKREAVDYRPYLIRYDDVEHLNSLIADLPGGYICVIYEPQKYTIDFEFIERMRARNLETATKKDSEKTSIPVPAVVFWFELMEQILTFQPAPWLTLIIDEAHELVPAGSRGDMWHLIEWFRSTAMISSRKMHISIILATQQLIQLDYRIPKTINKFFYLRGAKIPMWSQFRAKNAALGLPAGVGLTEADDRYGRFEFPRIKNQQPVVVAENYSGM